MTVQQRCFVLIWMLTWLPQVLEAMSELPQPVGLTMTSSNFRHILKWAPGPGTPTGVCYRVTVNTDTGSIWRLVAGCKCVQEPLVCNLAEAFSDQTQVYLTQVTAVLEGQTSKPVTHPGFKPIEDTHLDLPRLTVTPCGRDLCVDLQPPMEQLREIYSDLHYKLRIKSFSEEKAQFFKDTRFLKREILKDLAPGRKYCVSVRFCDSFRHRESNYSQPVCAFTPDIFTADALISATLCVLVMLGVATVALLVYTGFICLKMKILPSVLTSISHIEEVLVISPCTASLSSLLDLEPTPPSSVGKRSSQTSDESDEESVTESTGGCRGGGYELKGIAHLLFSSSSSSLSAPLSPKPEAPPSFPSDQTPHLLNAQPEAPPSFPSDQTPHLLNAQPEAPAAPNCALSAHTASHSDCLSEADQCVPDRRPPAHRHSLTERIEPNKEEKEVVEEGNTSDVNLLTLTFGRPEEEEEEEEESHRYLKEMEPESSSSSEVYNTTRIPPSQTCDTKEFAAETISCSADEEEDDEEYSGYMRRPCKDIMKNLI
ncbi:interleukin-10 receptor subunit beta-like [Pempheris klunzingeri]|uniref:interleukin-10 receptor subunit beta-like n=1 Tax=Pempheris klunzingeri TaxID=3127111 RepID=UPI00398110D8